MSTASERLDSLSPNAGENQIFDLAVEYTDFAIASECGHVVPDQGLLDSRCPTCGRTSRFQLRLFSPDELALTFICYRSERFRHLCIFHFCTLVEEHLRRLIVARSDRLAIPWQVQRILLRKHRRVDDLKQLFKNLTGPPAENAFEDSVFRIHVELREKRNNRIAHGFPPLWSPRKEWKSISELDQLLGPELKPLRITPEDVQKAVNATAESFKVFAALHDQFCSASGPLLPEN